MLNELAHLIDGIDLTWCDNPGKEIHETENYKKLLALFPNLEQIFQKGLDINQFEHLRTSRHIFRIYKVYFSIKNGTFEHELLSTESIQQIQAKIQRIAKINPKYIPVVIMYHDIGRVFNRKIHAYKSSELIAKYALFDAFGFSETEKLILRKVVEYHLLLPTIYTGESTFFGIISLINDPEFTKLISTSEKNYTSLFVDLLELFTYIDILGYPYSRIFDHYIRYYEHMNQILKEILRLYPATEKILSKAKEYSLQWTDWRLAGGLRIFQFIHTKPHLTKEFYYSILKESIRPLYETQAGGFNWDSIKNEYLANTYKFQLKYALPLLVLLAFNEFRRMRLKKDHKISSKLLEFWIILSTEIDKRNLSDKLAVWNIFFEEMPFWSEITKQFIEKLEIDKLKTIIQTGTIIYDERRKEFNFHLDFSQL